eukprot:5429692-Pleurochrysis_carterae.AAC.2
MADDDEAFPAPLPLGERVLIEEYTWMLVRTRARIALLYSSALVDRRRRWARGCSSTGVRVRVAKLLRTEGAKALRLAAREGRASRVNAFADSHKDGAKALAWQQARGALVPLRRP